MVSLIFVVAGLIISLTPLLPAPGSVRSWIIDIEVKPNEPEYLDLRDLDVDGQLRVAIDSTAPLRAYLIKAGGYVRYVVGESLENLILATLPIGWAPTIPPGAIDGILFESEVHASVRLVIEVSSQPAGPPYYSILSLLFSLTGLAMVVTLLGKLSSSMGDGTTT